MKEEKTWNLIGCILGIVVIIAGIYFAASPADSYSTSSVRDASFGGDFYTYVYDGVRTAVDNTAVTANNIRELGAMLALYSGALFVVLGALIEIHFAKLLLVEKTPEAADSPSAAPQEDGSDPASDSLIS